MREERTSGVGEEDATANSLEQRRAHLLLKEVDAAADRGLREMEAGRRPGESPDARSPEMPTPDRIPSAIRPILLAVLAGLLLGEGFPGDCSSGV